MPVTSDHRLSVVESRRVARVDAYCVRVTIDVLVSWVDRLQLSSVSNDKFV